MFSFTPALNSKIIDYPGSIIITGASGWMGKALLQLLANCLGQDLEEKVLALSNSCDYISLNRDLKVKCRTLEEVLLLSKSQAILCHFAFLTRDKVANLTIEDYLKANLCIRQQVSRIIQQVRPSTMIYPSSGAIYNKDRSLACDINSNPYGVLKLQDEEYFSKIAKNSNMDLIIPRVFNIAGPYINKYAVYALSDFIIQANTKQQILIKAKHPVIRSYVHVLDVLELCFSWLMDDNKPETFFTFDTASRCQLELNDLARLVSNLFDFTVPVIREYDLGLEADYYVGDIALQNILLDRYGYQITPEGQSVFDTYQYLAQQSFIVPLNA